jgi:class 3 adenylate cyclase
VGNIGSDEFRNFTAIGDTVNMAQRLGALAEPGQVVGCSPMTERLGSAFAVQWLEEVKVKGKPRPVRPGVITRAV